MAQKRAIEENAAIVIVESDVIVEKHTLQKLFDETLSRTDCGLAASVTVDEAGEVNYPYEYAKRREQKVYNEKKHFSFCCTMISLKLLKAFDFNQLSTKKHWHDVTVSHASLKLGFNNYLFLDLPVLHRPHSSRPWKKMKQKNILKYWWLKFTGQLDKGNMIAK